MPSDDMRRKYFKHKLGITDNELDNWVENTKNFSFAAMAEAVISVKCLGNEFYDTMDLLKRLMNSKPSSSEFQTKAGFEG